VKGEDKTEGEGAQGWWIWLLQCCLNAARRTGGKKKVPHRASGPVWNEIVVWEGVGRLVRFYFIST
jgi:hypothetical protein